MTHRDEVLKAITFGKPAYVPIYFFNQDLDQSDVFTQELQRHFLGPRKERSQWGFNWERIDETMGR
jgi:uroporphyrinogen decarboxylase